ncbi:dienelactone hydrolase family protein [Piscinibacter sakaiensis]|uniref:Putative carboxylesterase n=1 Tax=Piscinibacter sakaiensis TaxID=1547922 RepID=A0A0K8P2L1_PISS1|nr:dienelactone hydrolase family protein [Piscinibacter sakaiensis]GAP36410.1 putative carboxylesterase [Piscinibacter sakaiensis]
MTLECLEHATGDAPRASLIVLHGLGADGHDFVPVVQQLELGAVGPVRYVFPHAPIRPVTINQGLPMRAWYDIVELAASGRPRREDAEGLEASRHAVEALLAREAARGVPPERTVLMGFSQGCAMTLLTGLRHGHRLAGLVGLSGYLPLADAVAAARSPANAATPVFLAHGRHDPVIPLAYAAQARDTLAALGQPVEWHEYPMEHSVCLPELQDLNRWLLTVLA